MSAPTPIALGASPHLSQAHRKGLGERAGNRDFLTVMESLAEKDVAKTKADGAETASLSAAKASASGAPAPNSVLRNESGLPTEVIVLGYGDTPQSTALDPSRDARGETGGKRSPIELEEELQSLLLPVARPNTASRELPQGADARTATAASPALSRNSDGEMIATPFTTVADEMQLRVTRAASHFGSGLTGAAPATVQPKPSAPPSGEPQRAETTGAGPTGAPSAAGSRPVLDAQAPLGASLSPADGNGSPAVPIFSDVPLPLVPQALSEAVETLQTAQAPPTSAGAPEAVVHANGAVTRELEIRLSPAGLGSILVKMKLSGGALSVTVQASKLSTLNAVESAREAIIERLAANQVTALLSVKPLQVNQTQPEDTNAGSSGSAMREDSKSQANAGQKSPDRRGSRGEYRAPDQSGLGGARDLVL
jgi:flagellar hook-length control protein FliK